MLRIGQVEATATQDGKYTDGSVAGGIAATRLRAAAFNAMQEELAHIVESAGLALDINDMTQVLKAIQKLTLSRANPFADIKSDGAAAISTALTNLGLSKVMIGDWGYKMGFIADIKDQPYINHQASGDNILLATLDAMTTALADKQNKDTTLTSLSGKSIAELRTYLELKSAALRDIGTGANQIPDMSVQGFGSNWIKTVGGMIIQKGSVLIPTGQNYATTAFPIPFLSGGVVNLTWSDTPSNTGTTSNITYGVVVGSNLNTGFQAWMAGAGGYNLTYIAIGY